MCSSYLSLGSESIFWRSFSPRAQNTILEHASTEGTGWELAVDFSFCRTNPVQNLPETGANFVANSVPKSPRYFSALYSMPPKIHAESTPPSGPKSTPILETFFPVVSLGARPWFALLLFGCQYLICWPTKTCKLTISVLGTSSGTTQRASTQQLGFSSGQVHARSPLCLHSPNPSGQPKILSQQRGFVREGVTHLILVSGEYRAVGGIARDWIAQELIFFVVFTGFENPTISTKEF